MTRIGHNSNQTGVDAATVSVSLPTALVRLFPGSSNAVEIEAGSVSEVIDALDARWPGMRDRLTDSRPAIRKHLNIFVDGEKARLDSPVRPGGKVLILTAMSGG